MDASSYIVCICKWVTNLHASGRKGYRLQDPFLHEKQESVASEDCRLRFTNFWLIQLWQLKGKKMDKIFFLVIFFLFTPYYQTSEDMQLTLNKTAETLGAFAFSPLKKPNMLKWKN